jgi:hypothetical protein
MADADPRIDPTTEIIRHADTYHRFMLGVKWAMIHLASVISFLVVAFATGGGLLGGLAVGVVVFLLGVWAMRHGLQHSSEEEAIPAVIGRRLRR